MRIAKRLLEYVLAAIFLFSGLVKLNDPIGTKIKLEEYFDVFSQDFPAMEGFWLGLIPFSLAFSILLSSLEVIIAAALITEFKNKFTLKFTLGLLVFFGFLTFYSAYYDKVTDCGCFGEAIKLSPWTSFIKDLILLGLTLLALFIKAPQVKSGAGFWVFGTSILSVLFGILSYLYLPPWDSLPYAVDQNIEVNMQLREPLKFEYIYEIEGKTVKLDTIPYHETAKFISMTAVNENEAKALITDYRLWDDESQIDYTKDSFLGQKFFILIPDLEHCDKKELEVFFKSIPEIQKLYLDSWVISGSSVKRVKEYLDSKEINLPILSADTKVLKTMVRSNPGFMLLKNGTVLGKWSGFSPPTAENIVEKLNND